jgi:hypothetical protein
MRFRCRLTAPHLARKKSSFAFVRYAVPFPIGIVRRKAGSISGALPPLVAGAIGISAAIAIWMGHVVGVGVNTRVCHGAWRNTESERNGECNLNFGRHDQFLPKFSQFQRL